MICKNCDNTVESIEFVQCSLCSIDIHVECKQQCNKCGKALCDACAVKTKWKCSDCQIINEFKMDFISSTMFESYLKCPFSFKHENILNTIPEEDKENKYSVTGNLLHDLFEKYAPVRPLPDVSDLRQEYANMFKTINSNLFDSDIDEHNFYMRDMEIIDNWYQEELTKEPPLYVEKQHFVKIHDKLPDVRVTIDRINGKDGDVENWEVEDYKTGAVYNSDKLRTNMQLPIYAMAIKHVYGAYPKRLKLYFPQHQSYRIFERITDDVYVCIVKRGGEYSISLPQRLDQMIEIYDNIIRGNFPPNTKNQHFCQNFCSLGKKSLCNGLETKFALLKQRGY